MKMAPFLLAGLLLATGQVYGFLSPLATTRSNIALWAGPERHYTLDDGTTAPFYAMVFDKNGQLVNTDDADHLLKAIKGHTDVYMFSHGWNTSARDVRKWYDTWIQGYIDMRKDGPFPINQPYKPVLVGIIWPSKWGDSSQKSAAPWSASATESLSREQRSELVQDLSALLDSEELQDEFEKLGMKDDLKKDEYDRMFNLMLPVIPLDKYEEPATPEDVSIAFKEQCLESTEGLTSAMLGSSFQNPFNLFSFWQMRARAGTVGKNGVHRLLVDIARLKNPPRVHMLGHSFGARVVLAAVAAGNDSVWSRFKVDSILLLQPAVVHKVFNEEVEDGIYRNALERTKSPVVFTYSKKDSPLRTLFHVALQIHNGKTAEEFLAFKSSDDPPHKYAALGGYPPIGQLDNLEILDPEPVGTVVNFPAGKVCGMKMHDKIDDHSDIGNHDVFWLLYSLVKGE